MKTKIKKTIENYQKDPTRLMDILIDIQTELGCIPESAVNQIAEMLNISHADVEQTVSFYHFFSREPRGKYTVYINDSVVANMMGRTEVVRAFEEAAGCKVGSVSEDGLIGLFDTSCIGMSDQEPAALINNVVFTRLTPFRVKELVRDMKAGKPVEEMITEGYGDGRNNSETLQTMVQNNIRKIGPILSPDYVPGESIKKIIDMTPEDVIEEVKLSNIRGRGGAGFPTALKWKFCRQTESDQRYIFCNADEGEPGTFKDRVILTQFPRLVFEGMTVAGYAIGATQGIIYLRYEYKYMEQYLENVLSELRKKKLLGKNIQGKAGFDFDIRIQFGGGAYVCGEESALIESAEGKRGEPRDRPPFPVEKGYLDKPTVVNNVETLSAVVKVIKNGGLWYSTFGTKESTGTKLVSISGDCKFPGVYEIEWGFSVNDLLEMVGASKVQAVQVGGPSGALIGKDEFSRTLGYEDLATGGSIIIFNQNRDLLSDVVLNFTNFFIEESCGSCVPCRCLTPMLRDKLEKILNARGVEQDITDLIEWSKVMKLNRCGLGHTAANPILTSIKNFRPLYKAKVQKGVEFDSGFDLSSAIVESCKVTNRKPIIEESHHE